MKTDKTSIHQLRYITFSPMLGCNLIEIYHNLFPHKVSSLVYANKGVVFIYVNCEFGHVLCNFPTYWQCIFADTDECDNSKFQSPLCYGQCTNINGSFQCQCPQGTRGDPYVPGGCFRVLTSKKPFTFSAPFFYCDDDNSGSLLIYIVRKSQILGQLLPLYHNTCSWGKLVQVLPNTSISVQR